MLSTTVRARIQCEIIMQMVTEELAARYAELLQHSDISGLV